MCVRAHTHIIFSFCVWDEKQMIKTAIVLIISIAGQAVVSAKHVDQLQLRQMKALNGHYLKKTLRAALP